MTIRIFETLDITDRVLSLSREQAQWNEYDGLIAPVRSVQVFNSDGLFSPNSTNSVFAGGAYRNQLLEVFDDNGAIKYKGLIRGVSETIADGQQIVTIKSQDVMGSFLSWPVKASTSIAGVVTNAASAAGANSLSVPLSPVLSAGCIVSPTAAGIPSYRVSSVTTAGSQTLYLDRGLEAAIGNGDAIYVTVPDEVTTIPKALYDAFYTPLAYYGLEAFIGNSFLALHAKELALGHTFYQFVRAEEDIDLKTHLGKLLEIGSYQLTRNDAGVFELVEDFAYNGEAILDELTDDEICGSVESVDNDSRLCFGFSMLYRDGNNVKLIQYDLENGYDPAQVPQFEPGLNISLIEQYGGVKPFKPITYSSTSIAGYNYLFANEASAKYYGLKRLQYNAYRHPQYRLQTVKPFMSGNPNAPINLTYFKKMLLTLTVNENESHVREPVLILAYEEDPETGQYSNVLVELTNKPKPGLPVP